MPMEGLKINNVKKPDGALFDVVDEKGQSVSLSNLPAGARKIVFNKDELIKAKADAKTPEDHKKVEPISNPIDKVEKKEAVVETPKEDREAERVKKEQILLEKKIKEIDRIDKVRQELGAAESNTKETERLAKEKMEIQESLTGMEQQTAEKVNPQKDLEANVIQEVSDHKDEKPKGWESFKREWFNGRVEDESDYLENSQNIMSFSEDLANTDPEYKKRLADAVFEYEKNELLGNFKGVDQDGKLIKKDGTTAGLAYNLVGASMKRFSYERKLVEKYAREKGLLQ